MNTLDSFGAGLTYERKLNRKQALQEDVDILVTTQRDQDVVFGEPPRPAPFSFSSRRVRIDWRVLHGVDTYNLVRDVDLDTLERVMSMLAYGDIEAEDTRHLTETNFLKIFRMAQLTIEYLIFVQKTLSAHTHWLEDNRQQLRRHAAELRLRLRETDVAYRTSKRELRRTRRTVKTYEALATTGRIDQINGTMMSQGSAGGFIGAGRDTLGSVHSGGTMSMSDHANYAMLESAFRGELAVLSERLSGSQLEAAQLRAERAELVSSLKEIDMLLKMKGVGGLAAKTSVDMAELKNTKDQLARAHADIKFLRNEKDELSQQLESIQSQVKMLQSDREALLQDIKFGRGSYPETKDSAGPDDHAPEGYTTGGSAALSAMLLEAEERNKDLSQRVSKQQETIGMLQKQLMRAEKDAAKPTLAASGPSVEELQRLLSASESSRASLQSQVQDMEKQLAAQRRVHNDDLAGMQDELQSCHDQLADLRGQLAVVHSTGRHGGSTSEASLELQAAHSDIDRLTKQVSDLQGKVRKLTEQLSDKEAALADTWRLVKELESQLAIPAANRDADVLGRVKAQVAEFEQVAKAAAGLAATSSTRQDTDITTTATAQDAAYADGSQHHSPSQPGSPVRMPGAHAMAALLQAAHGKSSLHGNLESFKFVRPGMTVSPQETMGGALPDNAVASPAGTPKKISSQPVSPADKSDANGAQAGPGMVSKSGSLTPGVYRSRDTSPTKSGLGQSTSLSASPSTGHDDHGNIRHEVMRNVAGLDPAQLSELIESELRVQTENPFQFEDDDEPRFRSVLPHELVKDGSVLNRGVLSALPHTQHELQQVRKPLGSQVMAQIDAQLASYGIDPSAEILSDKEYAAVMIELQKRREHALSSRLDPHQREQAEFLREAVLTHLEMTKQSMIDAFGQGKGPSAVPPTFPDARSYANGATATTPSAAEITPDTAISNGMQSRPASTSVAVSMPQSNMYTAFGASTQQAYGSARASNSLNNSMSRQPAHMIRQGSGDGNGYGASSRGNSEMQTAPSLAFGPLSAGLQRTNSVGNTAAGSGANSPRPGSLSSTMQRAGSVGILQRHESNGIHSNNQSLNSRTGNAVSQVGAVLTGQQRPVGSLDGAPEGPLSRSLRKQSASGSASGVAGAQLKHAGVRDDQSPGHRAVIGDGSPSQQSLNQSLSRPGTAGSTLRTAVVNKQLAGVAAGNTLNASIRSTGNASLRNYSAHDDFEDDDESEEGDAVAPGSGTAAGAIQQQSQPRSISAATKLGQPSAAKPRRSTEDEYDMDGSDIDQGITEEDAAEMDGQVQELAASISPPKASAPQPAQHAQHDVPKRSALAQLDEDDSDDDGDYLNSSMQRSSAGRINSGQSANKAPKAVAQSFRSSGSPDVDVTVGMAVGGGGGAAGVGASTLNASAVLSRTMDRTSSPSRLAKMTSADHNRLRQGQPANTTDNSQPGSTMNSNNNTLKGRGSAKMELLDQESDDDQDDWNSQVPSPTRVILAQPRVQAIGRSASLRHAESAQPAQQQAYQQQYHQPVIPPREGHWNEIDSVHSDSPNTAHDQGLEVASVRSFNPNDTGASRSPLHGRRGNPAANSGADLSRSVGRINAMAGGAWSSPSATARSKAGHGMMHGVAGSVENSGVWNDTIQTAGSAKDELQTFMEGDAGLPAGRWNNSQGPAMGSARGSGMTAGQGMSASLAASLPFNNSLRKQMMRRDSFDTVSDVDFL